MIGTYKSVLELENALNLWADLVPEPDIKNTGGLFYIMNLPVLGDELLINGNFEDGATGWTLGDGWSVENGLASCDGSQVAQTNIFQNNVVEDDKIYLVEIYLKSIDSGGVTGNCGGGSATDLFTTVAIHKQIISEVGGTNAFYMTGYPDFIGSIDYVSCREVIGYLGDELLTNGNFEDGATGWTLGDGWSVENGVLSRADVGISTNTLQNAGLEELKYYRLETKVLTVGAGQWRLVCGNSGVTPFTDETGILKYVVQCIDAPLFFIIGDADFIGSFEYISCREVLE